MGRLYYFPRPLPDELIGSLLLRACRHYGIPLKRLAELLSVNGNAYWPLGMPRALDAIAEATATDPISLLWNNTLFPYATAYVSQNFTQRLADDYTAETAKGNSAVSQATTIGIYGQRYCPECLESDFIQFGETYWHRAHNLPLVSVCLKHQTALCDIGRTTAGTKIKDLPGDIHGTLIQSKLAATWAYQIAQRSTELLTTTFRQNASEWCKSHRLMAINLGADQQSGGIASKGIAQAFQEMYGHEFLNETGLNFKITGQPWPMLMLRPRQHEPFSTPKHVLLGTFLALVEKPNGTHKYKKPGRKTAIYDELDTHYTLAISQEIEKIRQGNQRATIRDILESLGIFYSVTHNRQRLPQSIAILQQFKGSSFSARQTGRRHYKTTK